MLVCYAAAGVYAVAGVFHQQQLCKTFRKKISISHYSFIADAYFLKGPVGEKHQPWRKNKKPLLRGLDLIMKEGGLFEEALVQIIYLSGQ